MVVSTLNLAELHDASFGAELFASSLPARILVTNDLRDLASLWPRTNNIGSARCYAFQCADILEVWHNTIGAARRTQALFVAIVDAGDRPLMLLPLGIECRHGLRVLTFLDGGVSDYNAPIIFPDAQGWNAHTIAKIWQGMQRSLPAFDIAIFDKMPEHVGDLPNPLMLFDTIAFPGSGHAITLSGTWADYSLRRLPQRQDSRRQRRRLGKIGTLKFEIAETSAQFDSFLDAMIRQKTRRYLETRGLDGFDRSGYRLFYPEMTRHSGIDGPVQLSALKLDDTIIATHWGYVVGSRFYYLMPTFEGGDWQGYSAGRLLLEHLLEWSFAHGLTEFDFTSGDEAYKFAYCDLTIPLFQAFIPVTLLGRVYARARVAKAQLRKLKAWRPLLGRVHA
jgi:CelD/BcsL family acetyltransferase involved in cellulose biosynthesis